MSTEPESRLRGRPRLPETQQRILDATLRALAEEGYARMSVDAIALAAGVTKPTIYRRYPSKAHLATAAIAALQTQAPPAPSGDTRRDLLVNLAHFREGLSRPNGMTMIGTLLAEEQHTPELIELFRERVVVTRRAWIREVLEAAQERGELRDGLDLDVTVAMLVGAYYARYLASGDLPPDWDERIVEMIWPAIMR